MEVHRLASTVSPTSHVASPGSHFRKLLTGLSVIRDLQLSTNGLCPLLLCPGGLVTQDDTLAGGLVGQAARAGWPGESPHRPRSGYSLRGSCVPPLALFPLHLFRPFLCFLVKHLQKMPMLRPGSDSPYVGEWAGVPSAVAVYRNPEMLPGQDHHRSPSLGQPKSRALTALAGAYPQALGIWHAGQSPHLETHRQRHRAPPSWCLCQQGDKPTVTSLDPWKQPLSGWSRQPGEGKAPPQAAKEGFPELRLPTGDNLAFDRGTAGAAASANEQGGGGGWRKSRGAVQRARGLGLATGPDVGLCLPPWRIICDEPLRWLWRRNSASTS